MKKSKLPRNDEWYLIKVWFDDPYKENQSMQLAGDLVTFGGEGSLIYFARYTVADADECKGAATRVEFHYKPALVLKGRQMHQRTRRFGGLGNPHHVELWSGGKLVRQWIATGKVSSEENSDGYYFMDLATDRLVEVSGSLVINTLKDTAEAKAMLKQIQPTP